MLALSKYSDKGANKRDMMNNAKEKNNRLLIAFIFIIMILSAISDNVRGIFVPSFKSDFSVSNTQIGTIIVIGSIGYIIFSYLGGILCEIIGHKKVLLIGTGFMTLSLITLSQSPNFIILLIGMFLLNAGWSLIGISINTMVPLLAAGFNAILMNLIHFSYGIGATITQKATGTLLYKGIDWRSIYLYIAILFGIVFITFIPVKTPFIRKAQKDSKIDYGYIFKNKVLYFYMIGLGLYVSSEMATSNWFVNYMKEAYNISENVGTYYTTVFFGIFALGRLFGGFIVEKLGTTKSVLISSILAFFFYALGIILGEKGLFVIALSGLFFAITFPTLILTVSNVFRKNSAYAVGIITMATSAISMAMNFFMGWLNDAMGVRYAYYTIPICLFISAFFIFLIHKNSSKREKQ